MPHLDLLAIRAIVVVMVHGPVLWWVLRRIGVVRRNLRHVVLQEERFGEAYSVRKKLLGHTGEGRLMGALDVQPLTRIRVTETGLAGSYDLTIEDEVLLGEPDEH